MEARTRIEAVRDVGPDAVAVDLAAPEGFDAEPGQFVLVRATVDGEPVARHYTVSSPRVGETFEVTVGIDPEGTLSGWLADRSPGDRVRVEGPFGRIHYQPAGRIVLLAGGPGIGGAVGIAERALSEGVAVALAYRDDGLVHGARLAGLAAGGASVFVVRERLEAAVAATGAADPLDDGRTYVIGFRGFVDEALAAIEARGGDPEAAMVENFGPS